MHLKYKILIIIIILIFSIILFKITQRIKIRNLLIKLLNKFDQNKIKYWIDFGSLLGVIREQDIIFGDNDGDVCILEDDEENIVKVKQTVEEMQGEFFKWGAFRVYDCKIIFIDIFLVKKNGSNLSFPGEEMIIPQEYILPTEKKYVKIGGKSLLVSLPKNPVELLELRYGKTWNVPQYKWYKLYF